MMTYRHSSILLISGSVSLSQKQPHGHGWAGCGRTRHRVALPEPLLRSASNGPQTPRSFEDDSHLSQRCERHLGNGSPDQLQTPPACNRAHPFCTPRSLLGFATSESYREIGDVAFGCSNTELQGIAPAQDPARAPGRHLLAIHGDAVVEGPRPNLRDEHDEGVPGESSAEGPARGGRCHRDNLLNWRPHFTPSPCCVEEQLSSERSKWHPDGLFSGFGDHANLLRARYMPQGGEPREALPVASNGVPLALVRRPMTSEALAFNEIQCQLVGRLQRVRLRVEDDASYVAPRAVFDCDLLHANPAVAGDGTHGVTTVLKAEPLLTAPSGLLPPHLQDSDYLAASILQGDDYAKQPRQLGGEKATLATVTPPRNRRTRLREDV